MAFDPRLGESFFFDAADLDTDRGVVSESQARGSERVAGYDRRPAGGAGAAGMLAWIPAIVMFFRRRGRKLTAAFERKRVLTAEDPLSIGSTMSDTWRAEVCPARFGIEPDRAEALEKGASHRVHHLAAPDGAIPISMERL